MRLIKPSYEIITQIGGAWSENILMEVEKAARTCYKSEGKIEYGDKELEERNPEFAYMYGPTYAKSARVLIQKLIKSGHEAMLEFGGMVTVRFICDRGVSHELVRHRVASFAQESTRYCNYGADDKQVTFIIPPWVDISEGEYGIGQEFPEKDNIEKNYSLGSKEYGAINWYNSMYNSSFHYLTLINDRKWSPQEARSVLPNSLKTEINVGANIREFRHILNLRCAPAAHPQMRELMLPLLKEFHDKIPILFDDIYDKYF